LGSKYGQPFSLGDALAEEAKALAKGSSLLLAGMGGVGGVAAGSLFVAGAIGVLFEELLAAGSLLVLVAGASGALLE
jgi:S-adenosylhomocysteine hydrolase